MDIPSEVQEFYEIARAYCTWAEGAPEESDEKAYQAMKYLASLYKQALILPSADPEDDQLEVEGITKLDSKRIYIRFSSLPFQYYHDAFHPVAQEPEKPTVGDLADDLMDIYIDLKEGVLLYESWVCTLLNRPAGLPLSHEGVEAADCRYRLSWNIPGV